jgi:uncharacterized protein YcgL (UPF0745 family)
MSRVQIATFLLTDRKLFAEKKPIDPKVILIICFGAPQIAAVLNLQTKKKPVHNISTGF